MRRLFPYPLLVLALLAMWLLLNRSLDPALVVGGAVLAMLGALAFARLQPPERRAHLRLRPIAEIAWLVLADVVRSNAAVATIVLMPGRRGRVSGFIDMQLEVRSPGALATLACIITATPGTSWARYDAGRNVLTIHIFDLVDEEAWMRLFKDKYERRLKEIFG
jgi:multicomponent K+:H+ antiporter subunit E